MQKSLDSVAARGSDGLLGTDEPPPFTELGRQGRSNFVIVVDHASRRIPRRLGDLGLPPDRTAAAHCVGHRGLAVARRMAATLDAPLWRRTIRGW